MTVAVNNQMLLTAAFQVIHTVHFQRRLTLRCIHLNNVTAGAVRVSVCLLEEGQVAQFSRSVLWDFSLPAQDFIEFGEGLIVQANGTIQALAASIDSVIINFSGDEA